MIAAISGFAALNAAVAIFERPLALAAAAGLAAGLASELDAQ